MITPGSRGRLGKIIIQPIGEAIVYVQPVYLEGLQGLGIPQLKALILSKGKTVVWNLLWKKAEGSE